jgi:hypothetical protein
VVKWLKMHGFKNILAVADVLPIDQETADLVVKAGATEGFTLTKMPDTYRRDVTDFQPLLNKIMEECKKPGPHELHTGEHEPRRHFLHLEFQAKNAVFELVRTLE